jgi:molecular chaperone GrpE (heat shock protein)
LQIFRIEETRVNKVIQTEQEFTSAMQQLSAEAEKTLPVSPMIVENPVVEDGVNIADQLQAFEKSLLGQFERFSAEIDKQLGLIRNTESVNQKLFDSLHAELLKYRDNFLHESLQKPFIHDLVYLYDHLNGLCDQLTSAAQEKGKRSRVSQWRDNLENAIHSLVEILHRFEVHEIEARETVDRAFHRVINFEPADFPEEDGTIVMRVKRGFVWRGKLIRPEEVIAKRYG